MDIYKILLFNLVWIKRLNASDSGDSTHIGGDHWDTLDQYFDNTDISGTTGKDAKIATPTSFKDQVLKIRNALNTFDYLIKAGTLTGNLTLSLPNLSGAATLVAAGGANDWGDAAQTFRNTYFIMRNPANSASYIFTTTAIVANRVITIPLLGSDDEILFKSHAATPLNKTYTIDGNTIKHSTTNANSDLLIYKTSSGKYDRLPRGTADQVLAVASDGLSVGWATVSAGGGGSADKVKVYEGGTLVGTVARKLNFNATDFNCTNDTVNDEIDIALAVSGGGGGAGADEIYSNLVNNGNKYGYWNGMSNLNGYGLLGDISGFDVTPTSYIDTTNGYTGSNWVISSTNAVGWKTNNPVTMRKLNPDVTFAFQLDENSDNTGSRFYAGFASSGAVSKSSSFLDSASGYLVFKHSSNNYFEIAHNDGSGTMAQDGSILTTNSGFHTIRLLADESGSRFGYSLDGGAITYQTSDIPSATATLHVVFNASDDDSTTRNLRGFYAKMKMKERA